MTTGATAERAPYPAAGQPDRERLLARLADRAWLIRMETVRLVESRPGPLHRYILGYTGTFSAAELIASLGIADRNGLSTDGPSAVPC